MDIALNYSIKKHTAQWTPHIYLWKITNQLTSIRLAHIHNIDKKVAYSFKTERSYLFSRNSIMWDINSWTIRDFQGKYCQWYCICWCLTLGTLQIDVLYSAKLLSEKSFVNFMILWLFANVFSTKLGAWFPLVRHKREIYKSFLCEIVFFTNSRKFPTIRY